jgi:Cu+-exporting ATPase
VKKGQEKKESKSKIDPVCGMSLNADEADYKATHNEQEYFFCCDACMKEFKKNPNKYAKAA